MDQRYMPAVLAVFVFLGLVFGGCFRFWTQLSCDLWFLQAVELEESCAFLHVMGDGGESGIAGIHQQADEAGSSQAVTLFIFGELMLYNGAGNAHFLVPVMVFLCQLFMAATLALDTIFNASLRQLVAPCCTIIDAIVISLTLFPGQ